MLEEESEKGGLYSCEYVPELCFWSGCKKDPYLIVRMKCAMYQFGADHGDLPYTLNHKMLSSLHDVRTMANGREREGLKGSLAVCYRIYGLVSTRARRSYCRFPGSFEACTAS